MSVVAAVPGSAFGCGSKEARVGLYMPHLNKPTRAPVAGPNPAAGPGPDDATPANSHPQ